MFCVPLVLSSVWRGVCGLLLGLVMVGPSARGQAPGSDYSSEDFARRPVPYPPYRTAGPEEYNLKWGRLTARVDASLRTSFTDNINLTETNEESDFLISPLVNLGFFFPVTEDQLLRFDLGLGYRWYINNPSLSSIYIAPNSHVTHRIRIRDVQIELHDDFGVHLDPTTRGDFSGTSTNGTSDRLVDFRRFVNTAGLTAAWQPIRALRLRGAYNFTVDTSLSDQFTFYDHTKHSFLMGADYIFSPQWSLGLNTSYQIINYDQKIQNDSTGYTIGPTVTWRATKVITLDASVGYSSYTFESNGITGDKSDFSGFTFRGGVNHQLNKRMSHHLSARRSVLPGLSQSTLPGQGSNFTDWLIVQYGLKMRLTRSVLLDAALAYENLQSSGVLREIADRYILNLGSGFQISQHWNLGVVYGFAFKDSDQVGRDYAQNRITLDFTRQF